MSLGTFLKGFKKQEFTYELEEKPELITWSREVLDTIAEKVHHLPVIDISIRSLDFSIRRANLTTVERRGLKEAPRSVVKVSNVEYMQNGYREMIVDSITLFLGLDYRPWIMEHKMSLTTRCMINSYDDDLINICICCTNTYIKENKVWVMTCYKGEEQFFVNPINELELDGTVYNKGYVATFGKHSDATSISNLIPNFYTISNEGLFEDIGKRSHITHEISKNDTIEEIITASIEDEYRAYGTEEE